MLIAIPRIQVVNFSKQMETGANKPWLVTCSDVAGKRDDYIIKFHNVLNRSIIREFAAGYMAACLEVKSPPIAIVDVPHILANSVTNLTLKERITISQGPHWGTRYLTGYVEFTIDTFIANGMIGEMIQLFAFDMLIQNQDRTTDGKQHGNPNLLIKGDDFVAIDHDKSFLCTDPIYQILPPNPWELRNENAAKRHVFHTRIRRYAEKNTLSFEPFIDKFKALPQHTITTMFEFMPATWRDKSYESSILKHLLAVQNNISRFSDGLLEVFA